MTEAAAEFVGTGAGVGARNGRGEEGSADMGTGMGIGASSAKGSVMAVSTVTQPAAPRAVSAS